MAVLKGTFFGKVDPFKCHWYQKGTSFKTGTYSSSKTRRSLIELQIWGGSTGKFDDYQLGSMDDKPAYS